ncbi:hypothetical protein A8M56_04635 [Yersinia pestis]|nr:hypothetical protein A8M56_04635 [Yersinia pestis]
MLKTIQFTPNLCCLHRLFLLVLVDLQHKLLFNGMKNKVLLEKIKTFKVKSLLLMNKMLH